MSNYNIYSNSKEINWNAKGKSRIIQNVNNLLNTFTHEVAYNRKMGRNSENVDKPIDIFIATVIEETYDLIEEYEPRATVKDVEFIGNDETNTPILRVVVEIE